MVHAQSGQTFKRNVTHYLDYELLRVITTIYATLRQIMADYGCYGNFFPLVVSIQHGPGIEQCKYKFKI
jgi:hypothetical protein